MSYTSLKESVNLPFNDVGVHTYLLLAEGCIIIIISHELAGRMRSIGK